tara:strand:- start:23216 stop:24973 length:1758 start_codon:yes stop_codon:yes gene_type:complete
VASYVQTSFSGGMNMSVDDTRLTEDEYKFAHNVRNRFGVLEGVKQAVDISSDIGAFTSNPPTQAIYTLGEFVFLFFDGGCKYRKPNNPDSTWTVLYSSGTMHRYNEIFVQAIPASTKNFLRKSSTTALGNSAVDGSAITLDTTQTVQKTVASIVVQDGVNTPKIIEVSGGVATDRTAKTFSQWKNSTYTSREYVPVGRQMAFFNNKLFVVSPDGTEIYHSVSGRPLDFVIPVNTSGQKINTDETIGGAPATSYTVGYNVITALKPLNNESLFVSTEGGSYAVSFDYQFTVFGEPSFNKQFLFTANSINQKSFIELLGDFAFIDPEGLRSFNAVRQSKNEARNSVFSLKVARLFKDVVQVSNKCAAITFDDYALFACNTIYGHGILVYDILTQQFVSFDQFTDAAGNIGPIMEFAKVETNNKRELFAITHGTTTSSGEPVYKCVKLYEGTGYETAYVETRAFCTNDTRIEQKPQELRILFNKVQSASSVKAIQRVNDEVTPDASAGTQTKTLAAPAINIDYPVTFPVVWSGPKQIQNLLYNFQSGQQGWKISYALTWTNGITLSNLQLETQNITPMNPMLSQAYVS